jgi:DNA-binding NarL/FixJ family response regulator
MPDRRRAVIVEDEFLIADYLADLCELYDVEVVGSADNGEDAIRIIRETRPDFVLMDVRLVGPMDGVEIAKTVYNEQDKLKIIYITGSNEPPTIARINSDHPYQILIKPILPDDLRRALAPRP